MNFNLFFLFHIVKRWFFRGEAKFTQGLLLGLATIRRQGDVVVDEANQQAHLHLVMDKLESHYEFDTTIFGVGPKGRCSVSLFQLRTRNSLRGFVRSLVHPSIGLSICHERVGSGTVRLKKKF